MRQKFTLITLGVRDFKKALSFYENLGWQKSDKIMEDLDGYLFEVAYNPFWEFDENDNLKL